MIALPPPPPNGGFNGIPWSAQGALFNNSAQAQYLNALQGAFIQAQAGLLTQICTTGGFSHQFSSFPGALLGGQALSNSTFEPIESIEHTGIRAGEVVAWRAWKINGSGFLTSVSASRVWAPGEPMTAETLSADLGIHAFKNQSRVLTFIQEYGPSLISAVGTVELWGEVVEHEIGYRAEFAAVRSIEYVFGGRRWGRRRKLRKLQKLYQNDELCVSHIK